MISPMRNNKGFMRSGIIVLLLAGAGIWYGFRSFKAGSLQNDLSAMVADCRQITGKVPMTAEDRAILDQTYATIAQIAAKYKLAPPAAPLPLASSTSP